MADRQRATAMYFIDRLALRAGNEKGEEEADTVGCCSLRCEHVTLEPPNKLVFDFLGKDSIRYFNRVQVDEQVFKNIMLFKKDIVEGDPLFDRVDVSTPYSIPATDNRTWRFDYFCTTAARVEQAFVKLHEGPDCESVPYVQRVDNVPAAARPGYSR